ncbi:MAG: nuclear transport factor 2 family protein [Nostoc sp. NOS(2021)]|uniref:nuclear transport factor 2 family protein n=1 Tax=Nostoc sp. NOS(2021) TaxID=2815407 RepID=UPI0025D7178E|nr:nuclear transport factor 2 family protein [Nostoc sp. NOS(2021)]MBN3897415.1 nuclear transport factor 2 family protein [Nostoc sp. NOS(2021)]
MTLTSSRKADYLEESLLREFEECLLQPDVRKSAKDVMDLLADEFIEFGSSGRVFDKQQIIKSLQNEPIEPLTQRSITEFKTLVLATGVILVTYRIVRHGGSGEQPVHSLRSSIWKLNNDRWKMIFHQGTLVRES